MYSASLCCGVYIDVTHVLSSPLLSSAQFSQNEDLRGELVKTRGTTLVEAAPRDTVWGIGLSAKNWKAKHREHWRGHNIIACVRIILYKLFLPIFLQVKIFLVRY